MEVKIVEQLNGQNLVDSVNWSVTINTDASDYGYQ